MADYRQIHTRIWKDSWFLDLSADEKLLFIYLFSNERASICGMYELALKVISFETGLDAPTVGKTLAKFSQAGKVHYRDGIVWIVNLRKYNENKSPKVLARINSDMASIPDGPMKQTYTDYYKGIRRNEYGMDTPPIPYPELDSEQEHEQEHEQDIPAAQPAAEESDSPTLPPVEVKRSPTIRQSAIGVLETHFAELTHLALPPRRTLNDRKKAATRWWNPLGAVYDAAGGDVSRARNALDAAYQRLRSGDRPLTVAAPQSVEKTALAVLAEQAGPSPRANGAYPLPEGV